MKRVKFLLTSAITLMMVVSCVTATRVPITGRKQRLSVSDEQMLSLSATQYKEYLGSAKKSTNATNTAMVQRVGQKLANAVTTYLSQNGYVNEVKNYAWEFNLVQSNSVNAFCMPGGKIVVYTGLMELISSDDELAVVLGHEVAHAVAKHANERMSQQMLAAAGAQAVGFATQDRSAMVQAAASGIYGLGAQVGALLPFSRKHEAEADYMGLALMTMAGYDPDSAPAFWRKMAAKGSGKSPEILSSHPSDASRVAAIEKALPEIKAKYAPRR